jgi:DNA adenine methylase
VYFWLASGSPTPLQANVSDANIRLIRCYKEIKSDPSRVWERLSGLRNQFEAASNPSEYYYRIREDFNASSPSGDAARFIFLMATGWNGVFRTNASGRFNVPFGATDKAAPFPSETDLFAAATVFEHASIRACSWETSLNAAKAGDFVFLDPPYYVEGGKGASLYEGDKPFKLAQHESLAHSLVDLQNRGTSFILTNGFSPTMYSIYNKLGLNVDVVDAQRSISSKPTERAMSKELIVTPGRNLLQEDVDTADIDISLKLKLDK